MILISPELTLTHSLTFKHSTQTLDIEYQRNIHSTQIIRVYHIVQRKRETRTS